MNSWASVSSPRLAVLHGAAKGGSINGEPLVSVWTTSHIVAAEEKWQIHLMDRSQQLLTHHSLWLRCLARSPFLWSIFFYVTLTDWLYRWFRWFVLLLNKTSLEMHFIYLDNKEIGSIFKTYCLICFIFQKIPFSSFFWGGGGKY